MGAYRVFLVTFLIFLIWGCAPALAGQTTLSGPATCYMPTLLEMKTAAEAGQLDAQAPVATSSLEVVEVKQEERPMPKEQKEEELLSAQCATDTDQSVTVYTICAK